jgi:lipoate-protein ligase A
MLYGEEILQKESGFYFNIYEPQDYNIILGRSRTLSEDVFEEKCMEDNVKVWKRISGGGTVLLAPGMFVWDMIIPTKFQILNQNKWFKLFSQWVISILELYGIKKIEVKGVSDLTIDNRKISGTSLFIGKNKVLYHGTLLLDIDTKLFDKYLKYPDVIPEYRKGRAHSEFVTTLSEQNITIDREKIKNLFLSFQLPSENDLAELK